MAALSSPRCTNRCLGSLIRCGPGPRFIGTTSTLFTNEKVNEQEKDVIVSKTPDAKEIFQREFPEYFSNGKFISRIGYVQFIDEALARMKELGLERDRNAYKELFRIFPDKAYHPTDKLLITKWQYFPQQLAATRILHQMSLNRVRIDKDFERMTVSIFSVNSEVWNKVARTNYWNMKLRNVDKYPIPEELPKEPHKLAKIGLKRMLSDELTLITTTNTDNLPDCIDKTWIVYAQSPSQKSIIEKLDEKAVVYIEEGGEVWVGRDSLSYYVMKYYIEPDEAKRRAEPVKPNFNYNVLPMKFYGKPIREKLIEAEEKHYFDGAYLLSVCMTGTSSQDSLSSWLKLLQQRNPKLGKLSVVFRTQHKPPDIIEYDGSGPDKKS